MSYDPFKAVHVHYHGERSINTASIGLLEEDYLLMHSCSCSGTRQKLRELDPEGDLIFRADFDPVLTWQFRATILDWGGLSDYHPGTSLSRQGLVFANGGRFPFQFRREASGEAVGVLYYEDPTAGTDGGDTQELDYKVTLEFSDLDTTNHPGEETYGAGWVGYVPGYTAEPPVPEAWAEIPAQSAAGLTEEGMGAVLADGYAGADSFGAEPLTLTLYDGDPAGAGSAISDAVELPVWTTLTELTATTSKLANQAAVEWEASVADRTCTHLQWSRNGIAVARKTLAAPLDIPAFSGVRAPIAALALQLAWSTTGATAARPASLFLSHLAGDAATGIISAETTLTVKCYDEDPETTGTLLDEFTVPRDGTTWTVAVPGEASNAIDLTGTDLAPFGDWLTNYITVEVAGVADLLYASYLSGDIATDEGDPITIPTGVLTQNLA